MIHDIAATDGGPRRLLGALSGERLRKYGSLYLLSALLVLAGGYFSLYSGGRPLTVDLREIVGTQIAYEALLLLVLACLHRVRHQTRDPLLLLGILVFFLLDSLLVQHLYGWGPGDGRTAGVIGASASLALLLGACAALRLPMLSRPVGTLAIAVIFARFAPAVLQGAVADEMAPRHVALGWMLAACLLPALLLPPLARVGAPHALPLRALDAAGTAAGIVAALLHFVPAGASFDLPLRAGYFAPFVVLLAPVIERAAREGGLHHMLRRVVGGLPWIGLMLAATAFPAALLPQHWAQDWPLTPFTLALALTFVVQAGRAVAQRDPMLAHQAAGLLALGALGGDLPAILLNSTCPRAWQAAAVALIAWGCILTWRRLIPGALLHALAAFVLSGALAPLGIPWVPAWIALLAWGPLLIAPPSLGLLTPRMRVALAAVATGLPVAVMLAAPEARARLVAAACGCAAAAIVALRSRDRVLGGVTAASAAAGLVGWPLSFQVYGEIRPGKLLIELGFLALLLGFANSLFGDRLRRAGEPPRRE